MAAEGSALDTLDVASLRRWARLVAVRLREDRVRIDELNVFPVPDGDTGTNLLLSVEGALASGEPDLARALLVSARGNSGVILSRLARGWSDVLLAVEQADAAVLAVALQRGDELAWAAVADPVEGTMLSVSRAAAAAAAGAAGRGDGLVGTVEAVVAAARSALAKTPEQLPALARAGVVDAGGAGLLVVLEALGEVVTGVVGTGVPVASSDRPVTQRLDAVAADARLPGADLDPDGPGYEVMFLLDGATDEQTAALRSRLGALGDSVLVAGGEGLWHVHVHTDDPGACIEAGIQVGRPHAVRVTHFLAQQRTADRPATITTGRVTVAVVACAAGAASEAVCADAGAVVVRSVPGAPASTGDVLRAVLRASAGAGAGADRVLVLPNDSEAAAVAGEAVRAAAQSGVRVEVAGSRSQVQVFAGLAVADPADADVLAAVAAAVTGCRTGSVSVAGRSGLTAAGPCEPGDVLGAVGADVVIVGSALGTVACDVVDHLLAEGGELVTLVPGLGSCSDEGGDEGSTALTRMITQEVLRFRTGVEVVVVGGGQPGGGIQVGCE